MLLLYRCFVVKVQLSYFHAMLPSLTVRELGKKMVVKKMRLPNMCERERGEEVAAWLKVRARASEMKRATKCVPPVRALNIGIALAVQCTSSSGSSHRTNVHREQFAVRVAQPIRRK